MKKKIRAHFTAKDTTLTPTRWILVADRSGAKIFKCEGKSKLSIVEKHDNPEGKKISSKLGADKPGRGFTGMGGRSSSLSKHTDPEEHQADIFAKHLATRLNAGRTNKDFEQLILVADPKFMGRVKSFMNKLTTGKISAMYEKDYAKLSAREVQKRLENLIE